jgi:hypothetical protein
MVKILTVLVLLLFLAACTMESASPTAGGFPYPVPVANPTQRQGTGAPLEYGLEAWLSDLAAANASVKTAAGTADQGFAIQGRYLEVNGARVSAYEFATSTKAESAAAAVSLDGSMVTRAEGSLSVSKHIDYLERIHWYRKGRLIVSHAGDDASILGLLARTLGPQFAGGFKLWDGPTPSTPYP